LVFTGCNPISGYSKEIFSVNLRVLRGLINIHGEHGGSRKNPPDKKEGL
jgi:hypothetical protein